MRLIQIKEYRKGNQKGYPRILVYSKKENKNIYTIYYSHDLENMFTVIQNSDILGVDKEMTLFYENFMNELVDSIHSGDLDIEAIKITTSFSRTKITSVFYNSKIGIVRNMEECIKCMYYMKKNLT